MEIKYIKGDATQPIGEGNKIIVHVCNDVGGWGRGFVMAISARWKEPELKYREWAKTRENFALGEVQFVQVEPQPLGSQSHRAARCESRQGRHAARAI